MTHSLELHQATRLDFKNWLYHCLSVNFKGFKEQLIYTDWRKSELIEWKLTQYKTEICLLLSKIDSEELVLTINL